MYFQYINKNNFIVRINTSYLDLNNKEIKESIKEILINIRKKYNIDIYGFFDVDIYKVDDLLYILKFNKKDKDEYFYKTVDLKIIKHNNNISCTYDDFLIDRENIYKKCEHYFINN